MAVLQAPVRMLAHSLFVLLAVTGLKLEWKSPPAGSRCHLVARCRAPGCRR